MPGHPRRTACNPAPHTSPERCEPMSVYRPQFQSCIEKCQACAQACDACCMHGIAAGNAMLAARARDCAAICRLAEALLAGSSDFSGRACAICQDVCRSVVDACAGLEAESCRECAHACLLCAAECQRMLAALEHGADRKPTGGPYAG